MASASSASSAYAPPQAPADVLAHTAYLSIPDPIDRRAWLLWACTGATTSAPPARPERMLVLPHRYREGRKQPVADRTRLGRASVYNGPVLPIAPLHPWPPTPPVAAAVLGLELVMAGPDWLPGAGPPETAAAAASAAPAAAGGGATGKDEQPREPGVYYELECRVERQEIITIILNVSRGASPSPLTRLSLILD